MYSNKYLICNVGYKNLYRYLTNCLSVLNRLLLGLSEPKLMKYCLLHDYVNNHPLQAIPILVFLWMSDSSETFI